MNNCPVCCNNQSCKVPLQMDIIRDFKDNKKSRTVKFMLVVNFCYLPDQGILLYVNMCTPAFCSLGSNNCTKSMLLHLQYSGIQYICFNMS